MRLHLALLQSVPVRSAGGQGPQLLFIEIGRHRDWLLQSYKPYVPLGKELYVAFVCLFDAVL